MNSYLFECEAKLAPGHYMGGAGGAFASYNNAKRHAFSASNDEEAKKKVASWKNEQDLKYGVASETLYRIVK